MKRLKEIKIFTIASVCLFASIAMADTLKVVRRYVPNSTTLPGDAYLLDEHLNVWWYRCEIGSRTTCSSGHPRPVCRGLMLRLMGILNDDFPKMTPVGQTVGPNFIASWQDGGRLGYCKNIALEIEKHPITPDNPLEIETTPNGIIKRIGSLDISLLPDGPNGTQ